MISSSSTQLKWKTWIWDFRIHYRDWHHTPEDFWSISFVIMLPHSWESIAFNHASKRLRIYQTTKHSNLQRVDSFVKINTLKKNYTRRELHVIVVEKMGLRPFQTHTNILILPLGLSIIRISRVNSWNISR